MASDFRCDLHLDSGVSIRFEVRGGFRLWRKARAISERRVVSIRFEVRGGFRPSIKKGYISMNAIEFQSALRFAVASDPTPWHAVLTSPVAAVLHTTPPHPLQQADRTCPKWGKTPSQVPYTPEAVFGRSPTPLSEGVSKTPAGSRDRRLPPTLPSCRLPTRSARHRRIRQDSSHHRVVQHPGRWMGLAQGPGLLPAGRALPHDPQ